MSEFKFDNPEIQAHFEREMEDGLEAYELRRILKETLIQQIQKYDNCSEKDAAKKWQAARETLIREAQTKSKATSGVECSREVAERIVRRAELVQAKDLIDCLPDRGSAKRQKSGPGCLGFMSANVIVIATVLGGSASDGSSW